MRETASSQPDHAQRRASEGDSKRLRATRQRSGAATADNAPLTPREALEAYTLVKRLLRLPAAEVVGEARALRVSSAMWEVIEDLIRVVVERTKGPRRGARIQPARRASVGRPSRRVGTAA